MRQILAILVALWGVLAGGAAHAVTCSATMSSIGFGSVSLRAGATNQTSGNLRIECTQGGLVGAVGACVTFGAGSGGAGGGLSPRYMRHADGTALSYELRPSGNGTLGGTWTSAFVLIPILLTGRGSADVTVFADITSSGTATGTGNYASIFSGVSQASLTYGVALCGIAGTTVAVPDFSVTATVTSSCEVDGAALSFGTIGSTVAGAIDQSTVLSVRCTAATPYAIRLGNGSGAGATGPERRVMTGPSSRLTYGLYQNPGRTVPWGDQPGNDVESTGTGGTQSFAVHGRIFPGQTAPVGLYTDSVIVTIEY